jgi:hypothetical protein
MKHLTLGNRLFVIKRGRMMDNFFFDIHIKSPGYNSTYHLTTFSPTKP